MNTLFSETLFIYGFNVDHTFAVQRFLFRDIITCIVGLLN